MVQSTAKLEEALRRHRDGRLDEAEALYREIVEAQPHQVDALNLLGMLAGQRGKHNEAARLTAEAVRLDPQFPEAHLNLGNALEALGQLAPAITCFENALTLRSDFAEAHHNRGNVLAKLENFADAIESFDRAIATKPAYAKAHFHKGNALQRLGKHGEAISSYDLALQLDPRHAGAHVNRGQSLRALGSSSEAVIAFEAALKLAPSDPTALCALGSALGEAGHPKEAAEILMRATQVDPDFAAAHYNLANTLMTAGRATDALASYDRAIALDPDMASAHFNRGNALQKLGRLQSALDSYDNSLRLRPFHGETHSQRGTCLLSLDRFEEAVASYRLALRENSDWPDVLYNRGLAFARLGKHLQAIADFERALHLQPSHGLALGDLWNTRQKICDWTAWCDTYSTLIARIENGERVLSPFCGLMMPSSDLQRRVVDAWARSAGLHAQSNDAPLRHPGGSRIRIGYFSADFRMHALSLLMAGHFEAHDRDKFEITAFSLGNSPEDAMGRRVRTAFDRFLPVHDKSDDEIALLSRRHRIEIAIDLGGYTRHARPGIFMRRAAPIQVSYMGFPGTMGTSFHDYLIADEIVIPPPERVHFSEKIAYLPDCYLATDSKREISHRSFSRSEAGLPETGFVFCCFNSPHKLNPAIFDVWMRILKQVEGSVLWLLHGGDIVTDNLRREAQCRGISPERIAFARFMAPADHLARHRLADLFLDTLPYNAHTTAADALWAGVPVLTLVGETFAGRVSSSLLKSVGLPELITSSEETYETLAVQIGKDRQKLLALKQRLRENAPTAPLFDTERFCRRFEALLATMHARLQQDLPPDHIQV